MEYDAFQAGVRAGGLFNVNLIRVLLCYLLAKYDDALNKDVLFESIQKEELANYFDIVDSYTELVKCGHIIEDENQNCKITQTGKEIAGELNDELPLTVREKAMTAIIKLLERKKIERDNKVIITDLKNGKNVNCKVLGGEEVNLFEFNLYVADEFQANLVKENFYKAPEVMYKLMLATLTEDDEMLELALAEFHRLKIKKK